VVNLYVWPVDEGGSVPAAADLRELRRLVTAAEASPRPPPTR
jgi:hypothetical protein